MDKGWGLTLESSDHQQVGFFGNKASFGFNLSPRLNNQRNKGLMITSPHHVDSSSVREEPSAPPVNELDFFAEKKSSHVNEVVKKEINPHDDEDNVKRLDVNIGLQLVTRNPGSYQSTVDDDMSVDEEEKRAKLEMAQVQIQLERMNAENQRLKGMLTQVSNNFAALQMHLMSLMQHKQKPENEIVGIKSEEKKHENEETVAPRQFIDLVPRSNTNQSTTNEQISNSSSEERTISASPRNNMEASRNKRMIGREESPESESWNPNKAPKLINPPKPVDQSSEATMRKARVSVRARSEAPMISDGCQWRKYGQKMAKGNPFPRAYYRCTMAAQCPVRKQVQRCAEDNTILITTYEGNHNHPLPPTAMTMASTTSAAANMLLSGSMPSSDTVMNPNFLARTILPYSSNMATISASAPFPTVTLDLTQTPNNSIPNSILNSQRTNPPQFQFPFHHQNNLASMPPPQAFGQALYNQSKFSGLQMSQEVNANNVSQSSQQNPAMYADTISAITADPNFSAVLAQAISSIIASSNNNDGGNTNNNTSSVISGNFRNMN